jgi:hypothetical protein
MLPLQTIPRKCDDPVLVTTEELSWQHLILYRLRFAEEAVSKGLQVRIMPK